MATEQDLVGLGMPPALADLLGITPQSVTGAGTTQGTAAAIYNELALITGASSNTGAILPATAKVGVPYILASIGGTAAKIYAPVGHTLNGVASSTGLTFSAATGTVLAIRTGATTWVCTGTATLS